MVVCEDVRVLYSDGEDGDNALYVTLSKRLYVNYYKRENPFDLPLGVHTKWCIEKKQVVSKIAFWLCFLTTA